jgi:hypothetical protein
MQEPIASEIDSAAREAGRLREFGQTPRCAICEYSGRTAFIRVRRVLLQEHHINGRANDPTTTVLLCLRCHAELHENARDAGASLAPPTNVLDRAISVVRLHIALTQLMLDTQADLATDLALVCASLDEHFPGWRQLPEAAP